MTASSPSGIRPRLFICIFVNSLALARPLVSMFDDERYKVVQPNSQAAFFDLIEREKQQLDCLILQDGQPFPQLIDWLQAQATLLPTVILDPDTATDLGASKIGVTSVDPIYHTAEIRVPLDQLKQITEYVDTAIAAFLNLSPSCRLPDSTAGLDLTRELTTQNFLMLQQRRLTDKLKERLGYLGVYYKRNPQDFLRHLPPTERHALLAQLRKDYREIILTYFTEDVDLNQKVDNFVNAAFFADIPVAQIVEIHMDFMDEFSKQLKLEGRSEEVLLDYRLTLIDTIAHLCEMYRRSVPRES